MRIEGSNTEVAGDDSAGFNGGGAHFRDTLSLTIDRVWFDRNQSGSSGGVLHVLQRSESGPLRITRSTFTHNTAVRDGGGLSPGQGRDISVSNNLFADNIADRPAGGIDVYLGYAGIDLSWNTVTGNASIRQGGGISLPGLTPAIAPGSNLISGNTDAASVPDPNCVTGIYAVASSGYNRIGALEPDDCVLAGDTTVTCSMSMREFRRPPGLVRIFPTRRRRQPARPTLQCHVDVGGPVSDCRCRSTR